MCSVISNIVLQNIHVCFLVSESALDGLDAPRTGAPSPEMSPTTGDLWCCKAQGPIQTIGAAMLDARRTRKATLDRHYGCDDVRCASRPIGPQRCPRIAIKGWSPTVPDPLESFDDLKIFHPFFTKKKHVMSCFPAKICMQHKHAREIRISNNMPNKMQKSTSNKMFCFRSDVKIYVRQKVKVYSEQNAN